MDLPKIILIGLCIVLVCSTIGAFWLGKTTAVQGPSVQELQAIRDLAARRNQINHIFDIWDASCRRAMIDYSLSEDTYSCSYVAWTGAMDTTAVNVCYTRTNNGWRRDGPCESIDAQ